MSNTSQNPDTSSNSEVSDEDEEVEQEQEEPIYVGYTCAHCGGGHLGRDCNATPEQVGIYQRRYNNVG